MTKKNLTLIVALGLPLIVVLLVLFNNVVSGVNYHPTYNFVFSLSKFGPQSYSVSNHKVLLKNPGTSQVTNDSKAASNLFVYDVVKDKAYPIDLSEAERYQLDPNPISPDHYKIRTGYDSDNSPPFLSFFGGNGSVSLEGESGSKRINLPSDRHWQFEFLGWIPQ